MKAVMRADRSSWIVQTIEQACFRSAALHIIQPDGAEIGPSPEVSTAKIRLAAGRISQLTARNISVFAVPVVVADGAPLTGMVNLHPPFKGGTPANQAQFPCAGRIVVPNGDQHILDRDRAVAAATGTVRQRHRFALPVRICRRRDRHVLGRVPVRPREGQGRWGRGHLRARCAGYRDRDRLGRLRAQHHLVAAAGGILLHHRQSGRCHRNADVVLNGDRHVLDRDRVVAAATGTVRQRHRFVLRIRICRRLHRHALGRVPVRPREGQGRWGRGHLRARCAGNRDRDCLGRLHEQHHLVAAAGGIPLHHRQLGRCHRNAGRISVATDSRIFNMRAVMPAGRRTIEQACFRSAAPQIIQPDGTDIGPPPEVSIAENRLAAGRISQLIARNISIFAAPVVVADGAPLTVMVNLHPPLRGGTPADQAQFSCAGESVVLNGDQHILDRDRVVAAATGTVRQRHRFVPCVFVCPGRDRHALGRVPVRRREGQGRWGCAHLRARCAGNRDRDRIARLPGQHHLVAAAGRILLHHRQLGRCHRNAGIVVPNGDRHILDRDRAVVAATGTVRQRHQFVPVIRICRRLYRHALGRVPVLRREGQGRWGRGHLRARCAGYRDRDRLGRLRAQHHLVAAAGRILLHHRHPGRCHRNGANIVVPNGDRHILDRDRAVAAATGTVRQRHRFVLPIRICPGRDRHALGRVPVRPREGQGRWGRGHLRARCAGYRDRDRIARLRAQHHLVAAAGRILLVHRQSGRCHRNADVVLNGDRHVLDRDRVVAAATGTVRQRHRFVLRIRICPGLHRHALGRVPVRPREGQGRWGRGHLRARCAGNRDRDRLGRLHGQHHLVAAAGRIPLHHRQSGRCHRNAGRISVATDSRIFTMKAVMHADGVGWTIKQACFRAAAPQIIQPDGTGIGAPPEVSTVENRLAAGRISQLIARNISISAVPVVVADGAPLTRMVNLHPPFRGGTSADQAQIPCVGIV